LQAGVFTTNLEHAFMAFREIEAGAVIVGDTGVFRVDTIRCGGVKGSGAGAQGRALGDGIDDRAADAGPEPARPRLSDYAPGHSAFCARG
jgi:acyl-CoA reductase-like NAD-dependent aldehyde dehydrogenase